MGGYLKYGGLLAIMVAYFATGQSSYAQSQAVLIAATTNEDARLLDAKKINSEAEGVAKSHADISAEKKLEIAANDSKGGDAITDNGKKVEAAPPTIQKKKHKRPAEIHSNLQIGLATMTNRNPGKALQFGKLTGVTEQRVYFLGAANIQSQNGRSYWNLKADDIGLGNQSFNFDGGTMGKYKLHFGYSELDNLISANSKTPFDGAGGGNLTLPLGFTPSENTTDMTNLAVSLKSVELGTQRQEGDVSFAYRPDKNLGLSFSFRRYLKNGIKSVGTLFRDDNIGPQSMILPDPVNYHTDEFRTGVDWLGERSQISVEYYFSRFNNYDTSLVWDNPFAGLYPIPYPDQGRNSLPPDNQHQRLTMSASISLASATRLSAVLERGVMTQDETFLPYTINSSSNIPTPLPTASAKARIDTTLYKLDLATKPLPALLLHAGYRHYATDNKTPRNLYQLVVNDSGNQVSVSSPAARYNLPSDVSRDQLKLGGSYYYGKGTTLKLGYDRDHKKYHYRAVDAATDNIYSAKLNKRWDAGATAFIDLAQGRKRSKGYDYKRVFESAHSAQYLASLAPSGYFDNLPGMRQFDIADRNSAHQGMGVILLPRPDLTVGMNVNRDGEKYNASQFGLIQRDTGSVTLDTTLTLDDTSSWSFYYTRQGMKWQQSSRAYYSFLKATQSTDPANDWSVQSRDEIDTVGINITLSFMDDTLPVRLSYAFANINTDTRFTADSASIVNTPPVNLPTLKSERHTFDLSGTYSIQDNMSVKAGAMAEFYRSKDWATNDLPPGSSAIPEVLVLSGSEASYQVLVLSLALNYQF